MVLQGFDTLKMCAFRYIQKINNKWESFNYRLIGISLEYTLKFQFVD